jgi:Na+/H+-dicarboxylate symporter
MHALRGRLEHLVGCAWFWAWVCLFVAELKHGGNSLDARPWLLVGLMLAAVGIAGHALRSD